MDTDKRPLYIWLFAILVNVLTYLLYVKGNVDIGHFGAGAFSLMLSDFLIYVPILFFIYIVPTFLSGLNFKWRNYLGYGIPILVILYSVWQFYTCDGKFCGIWGVYVGAGGAIFIVFYALGVYLRKWNEKVILSLLLIEIILLVGVLVYNVYHSQLNSVNSGSKPQFSSLQEDIQSATTPF